MSALRKIARSRGHGGKTVSLLPDMDDGQRRSLPAQKTNTMTITTTEASDLSLQSHSDLSASTRSATSYRQEPTKSARAYDFAAKVILLGDFGVGKTSLLRTLGGLQAKNAEEADPKACTRCITYRPNEFVEMECIRNDKRVLIRVMDTGGQERFRSMTSSYFRGAHGCLLMFDATKETSFDNIINWYNNLDVYAAPEHISALLVGAFRPGQERRVTSDRAFKLAESLQLAYLETDVRDQEMVLWILQKLVNNVIMSRARRQSLAITIMPPLRDKAPAKKKRFTCCGTS